MRNRITNIVFVLFLIAGHLNSQTIEFSVQILRNPDCHGGQNGKIYVSVIATDPPYEYEWNNGDTTSLIDGLGYGVYTLRITDASGNDTSTTIKLRESECGIYSDIVFTPNGDGINDTWGIYGLGFYPENKILVYNRWGQKVYEHQGEYNEPWDGRDLFGVPVPDNTYYYIIYGDKDHEASIVKGNISILR